jgi:hypothetical protein
MYCNENQWMLLLIHVARKHTRHHLPHNLWQHMQHICLHPSTASSTQPTTYVCWLAIKAAAATATNLQDPMNPAPTSTAAYTKKCPAEALPSIATDNLKQCKPCAVAF